MCRASLLYVVWFVPQDVGELGLCRIVVDLGVAGDGLTSDKPGDGAEEVDMRSQVSRDEH